MSTLARPRVLGLFAVAFGLLTIFSGGTALFGGEAARSAVGNAVPFVLWFNFIAGFAYVVAGLAILGEHSAARPLAMALFAGTAAVFVAFLVHVMAGGAYEIRTMVALILRAVVWLGISMALRAPSRTVR